MAHWHNRYFGAFQDHVLESYFNHFHKFELASILEYLEKQEFAESGSSPNAKTLADISPAVLYYILCDPKMLQEPKIFSLFLTHGPKRPIAGMPKEVPPVGLFILLTAQDDGIRKWAQQQVDTYTVTPMRFEHYLPVYSEVLEALTRLINPTTQSAETNTLSLLAQISQSQDILWNAYSMLLRFVPKEKFPRDAVRVTTAHLSDTGSR